MNQNIVKNTLILELFQNAGYVAWPLGLLSIIGFAIVLERLFTLARLSQMEDRAFHMLEVGLETNNSGLLRDPEIAAAPVTQIMTRLVAMRRADRETLFQAASIGLSQQRLRLRRYLGIVATIASTSPFIGLFGTVLGIIVAFRGMSTAAEGDKAALAAGISEALSATALGLLVAIPAVIAYNLLVARTQAMLLTIQSHATSLIPLLPTETSTPEATVRPLNTHEVRATAHTEG